ncbi:MAG: L-dopachrome tautomerase-related protein [Planctomycetota bacterium]
MSYLLPLGLAAGLIGCSAGNSPGNSHLHSGNIHNGVTTADVGHNRLVVELARFDTRRPAAVAVSSTGRVFVAFPWLDTHPDHAVGELNAAGETVPYPDAAWNRWDAEPGPSALRAIVSATALTVTHTDDGEFLWVLDAGNPRQRGVVTAGPKLFKIDLADDTIANVYYFDHKRDFAPDALLRDVRIDAANHTAYLADARGGAVYALDLRRRSVRCALRGPVVTGGDGPGLVGLELSADHAWLYFHAPSSRTLHRVPTAVLRDRLAGPEAVAAAVETVADTDAVVAGLGRDPEGRTLFLTAPGRHAVLSVRDGTVEPLVADARLGWPDAVACGPDGYLYLAASNRPDAASRGASGGAEPGYVLKVSRAYLVAAAQARRELDMAEAAAAESAALATQAERRVADAKQTAEHESAAAAAALAQVSAAARTINDRRFALARAEQAQAERDAEQQEASLHAEAEAVAAAEEADRADVAAAAAEEAARVAALRAEEAASAVASAESAAHRADAAQSDAASAAEAYEHAVAASALAAAAAAEAQAQADRLQSAAEAVQARARVAADAWQAEQQHAAAFVTAADRAARLAEVAAASLERAELAELETSTPVGEAVEVADVPVTP